VGSKIFIEDLEKISGKIAGKNLGNRNIFCDRPHLSLELGNLFCDLRKYCFWWFLGFAIGGTYF
jgi:hypothetical protein